MKKILLGMLLFGSVAFGIEQRFAYECDWVVVEKEIAKNKKDGFIVKDIRVAATDSKGTWRKETFVVIFEKEEK